MAPLYEQLDRSYPDMASFWTDLGITPTPQTPTMTSVESCFRAIAAVIGAKQAQLALADKFSISSSDSKTTFDCSTAMGKGYSTTATVADLKSDYNNCLDSYARANQSGLTGVDEACSTLIITTACKSESRIIPVRSGGSDPDPSYQSFPRKWV
jgi:hypothetical protein